MFCRHLEEPAFPGTLGSVQTLHPHTALPPSYADGPVQAHLQTGALAGIKSIYTCVLMIYHTTLVKAVSEARKPLPLFESVPTDVCKRTGTGESSGHHVRVLSNRKVARDHKVIYHSIITQHKAK